MYLVHQQHSIFLSNEIQIVTKVLDKQISCKIQLKTLRSISYYKQSLLCFVVPHGFLAGSVLLVTTNSFIRQIRHAAKLCPNIYVSSTHLGQLVVYSKCSFCPAIPSLQQRRNVRKFGGGGHSTIIDSTGSLFLPLKEVLARQDQSHVRRNSLTCYVWKCKHF